MRMLPVVAGMIAGGVIGGLIGNLANPQGMWAWFPVGGATLGFSLGVVGVAALREPDPGKERLDKI